MHIYKSDLSADRGTTLKTGRKTGRKLFLERKKTLFRKEEI